jgi:hypothetical protein
MGGQACVLYGAAEFSRDTDLVLLADRDNLTRLQNALDELEASPIALPPFELQYLERGHAIHFAFGTRPTRMRIDVMSRMRNVDPFSTLWERRTTLELPGIGDVDLLSLPDLVQAKKTQRDKDWPMIRRLVEVNYLTFRDDANEARIRFWLTELRTPSLLREVVQMYPRSVLDVLHKRPWLVGFNWDNGQQVEAALMIEETTEREADRAYWVPLIAELESMRHSHS